jgi:hypothetical protein
VERLTRLRRQSSLFGFPPVSLASPPLRCANRLASDTDALQFPLRTRHGEQALDATTATKQSRMGVIFRRSRDGFVFVIRL